MEVSCTVLITWGQRNPRLRGFVVRSADSCVNRRAAALHPEPGRCAGFVVSGGLNSENALTSAVTCKKPGHLLLADAHRLLGVLLGVADGTRTNDDRNHNPPKVAFAFVDLCM